MSEGSQHREDTGINREEHAVDGGVDRKRVGLFAKDSLGIGILELSALSTASGAVLSTTPASVSIGGATLFAVVNTSATPLNPFHNFQETGAVVQNNETIVNTYSGGNNVSQIQGWMTTGTAEGVFKLKVNGTVTSVMRSSAAERTIRTEFASGIISAGSGATITITATHPEVNTQTFDSNLWGYNL